MDLEGFIREVLSPVLNHPESFQVEVNTKGKQTDVFLYARQEDRGRIIGRNGRMISALRTLCKTAGEKRGVFVNLELVEDEEPGAGLEA